MRKHGAHLKKTTFSATLSRNLKTTKLANLCLSEPDLSTQSPAEPLGVMLIDEFASLLGLAKVTVYRTVADERKHGTGQIPMPISRPGGKMRWRVADVERFLQSTAPPPRSPPQPPPVNTPINSSKKQAAKSYQNRQEAARQALKRHGINH